jgi:predicted RNA-binding Zn-ribbon protein involved in translation (DUF1610 family)
MSSPKILTLDIETAPLKVYAWGLWDQNTGINMIESEWTILSVCAKWLGQKPMYQDTSKEKNPRDDTKLLRWVHGLLDTADIVVSQNGTSFDMKKINARLLAHGFLPYAPVRQIDTKLVAKKHFNFTSNKLEWMASNIAHQPKSKHKKFPGFDLWDQCLKGNKAAWREMRQYNIQDVIATEALYLEMRPWIEGHPNVAVYLDDTDGRCPKCGSTDIMKRGLATTQFGRYHRYQCKACGGWSRGSRTVLEPHKRRSLMTN